MTSIKQISGDSRLTFPGSAAGCGACRLRPVAPRGACPFQALSRPAGTLLLYQGEMPESVWIVHRGTVLLSATSADGDETFCSLRGPGNLLGLELLRGRPADADVWALSELTACYLGAEDFRAWVGDRSSPLGAVLDFALDESARRREERLALSGHAVARVARFLLERRRVERGGRPLHVEQQVLARMLGMRPETLSRVLHRLRAAGIIADGRGLEVRDARKLAELAGGEDEVYAGAGCTASEA